MLNEPKLSKQQLQLKIKELRLVNQELAQLDLLQRKEYEQQ